MKRILSGLIVGFIFVSPIFLTSCGASPKDIEAEKQRADEGINRTTNRYTFQLGTMAASVTEFRNGLNQTCTAITVIGDRNVAISCAWPIGYDRSNAPPIEIEELPSVGPCRPGYMRYEGQCIREPQ